jgi:positive regulator of sigma E activity
MKRLPISLMLLDTFSGALAILMLVIAALLAVLITMNHLRGEGAANEQLLIMSGFFVLGSTGFYALRRWARRVSQSTDS